VLEFMMKSGFGALDTGDDSYLFGSGLMLLGWAGRGLPGGK
jgi:hypothetical protein